MNNQHETSQELVGQVLEDLLQECTLFDILLGISKYLSSKENKAFSLHRVMLGDRYRTIAQYVRRASSLAVEV